MKSSFVDFLVCGLLLALIGAASLAAVIWGVRPWSLSWCGSYHVIIDLVAGLLAYGAGSALALRALLAIKPLPEGTFAMDSAVFAYWKVLTVLSMLGQWSLLPFDNVFTRPLIVRLYGARIGADVALGGVIGEPFLVTIGAGAVLGHGSVVAGSVIADGRITIGRVRIGAGATIGVHAVAMAGITLGAGAKLVGGSMLIPGTAIPPGEVWRGNPARKWSAVASVAEDRRLAG